MTKIETLIRQALVNIDANDPIARANVYKAAKHALEKLPEERFLEQKPVLIETIRKIENEYSSPPMGQTKSDTDTGSGGHDAFDTAEEVATETHSEGPKKNSFFKNLIIMTLVSAFLIAGYFVYMNRKMSAEGDVPQTAGQTELEQDGDATSATRTVFSFDFPQDKDALEMRFFNSGEENDEDGIVFTARAGATGKELIPVDTGKVYLMSATFRIIKENKKQPLLSVGLYTFDENKASLDENLPRKKYFVHANRLNLTTEKTKGTEFTLTGLITGEGPEIDAFYPDTRYVRPYIEIYPTQTTLILELVKLELDEIQ